LRSVIVRRILRAVRWVLLAVVAAVWQGAFVAGCALLLASIVFGVTTSHTETAAAAVVSVVCVAIMRERQRRVLRRRRRAALRDEHARRLRDLEAERIEHEQQEIAVRRARLAVRETLARQG
jgi:hypothetical protein